MYTNVPYLVSTLKSVIKEPDDGVYFGRWPAHMMDSSTKNGIRVCVTVYVCIQYSYVEFTSLHSY